MQAKDKKGNQEIKRIRKELGLTQAELAFPGMTKSVIAKLESGERELNPKQATILAARFQELSYTVSARVLMGQDKDVAEILKMLENGVSEVKLNEIDSIILKLENDKAVELILGVIQILKVDVYSYANTILKYILKLNEFKIDKDIYIKINLKLIGIYTILEDYNSVLIVVSAIKIYEDEFNKRDSAVYNFNIANAYYYLGEYEKSKKFLSKSKKFNEHSLELHILTVESNILTMEKNFEESIKIAKKIISKAIPLNLKLYIANALSNISYMLTEQNQLDEAQKYMDKAFLYYNDIQIYYKFNILNNKFYLQVKKKTVTFEEFKKLILLSLKVRDGNRMNENIVLYIDYCLKYDKANVTHILSFLSNNNIIIEDKSKLQIIKCAYGSQFFTDILTRLIS